MFHAAKHILRDLQKRLACRRQLQWIGPPVDQNGTDPTFETLNAPV